MNPDPLHNTCEAEEQDETEVVNRGAGGAQTPVAAAAAAAESAPPLSSLNRP
jgi:hypothetical protein